jgi:hypothetical protein
MLFNAKNPRGGFFAEAGAILFGRNEVSENKMRNAV